VAHGTVFGLFLSALDPLGVAAQAPIPDYAAVPSGRFTIGTPGRSFGSRTP
jgi:hypothetical protein